MRCRPVDSKRHRIKNILTPKNRPVEYYSPKGKKNTGQNLNTQLTMFNSKKIIKLLVLLVEPKIGTIRSLMSDFYTWVQSDFYH